MAKYSKKQSEAVEFLLNLHSASEPGDGLIELRAKSAEGPVVAREFCASYSKVERFVEKYGKREDKLAVYYGVGLRSAATDGKKGNVLSVPALWSDIDVKKHGMDFATIVRAFHELPGCLQPSALVHSGGGLHAYWLLDVPFHFSQDVPEEWLPTVAHFEAVNKMFGQHTAGDAVQDISRVLRLPGSYNCKRSKPCHVIWFYRWHRHNIITLERAMDEFGLYLGPDGFVPQDQLPSLTAGIDAKRAYHYATDPGRRGWEDKMAALWEHTRIGGGFPYHGLDEAQLLATAYLWAFDYLGEGGMEGKKNSIIRKVMRETERVKLRDAPGEFWNMDAEREKVAEKLERWVEKWAFIAEARAQEKRMADKAKREAKKAAKSNDE